MREGGRIVSNLAALVAKKAEREGRKITYRTVVEETGVSMTSVQRWMTNRITKFHADQITAFCRWLRCEVGDLLQVDFEEE